MRLQGRLTPSRVAMAACAALVGCAVVGCGPANPGGGPAPTGGGTGTIGSANPTPTTPPATQPTAVADYKVTYGFAVPSATVTVKHTVNPPIGGPSDPPLPYLVGIYVGDHPEGAPKYQRISFYFRGAFPTYAFGYVRSVISDGQGTPISLQGNAFLRIVFSDAQAHDNAGASTVAAKPTNPIGLHNLKSYGPAGDFEGHVTYGLGLQAAPNSDQILMIRSGELKKPDGSGSFFYVVHFDVQTA